MKQARHKGFGAFRNCGYLVWLGGDSPSTELVFEIPTGRRLGRVGMDDVYLGTQDIQYYGFEGGYRESLVCEMKYGYKVPSGIP